MSNEERLRKLLSDLGKATLRGVRKCPKCGTYNGSRGLCCKNKYCDAVFKEPGEKRKLSTEACKLITGSTAQVFSVRVRDKGPDYRGFVQLPLINATISNEITTLISQTTALCFVDTCERSFDTSVLKCHEKDSSDLSVSTCQHIQAALRCYAEAQPLTLRNSILSSLNVNNEMKQEIWLLATETSGPLVQRVSKNIMAVKCKASPKHPLGYLHFSFFVTKLKDRVEHRCFCSCTAFKVHNLEVIDQNGVQFNGNTMKILDEQTEIDTKYNVLNSQYILNDNNIKILNTGNLKVIDTNTVLDVNNIKLIDTNAVINGSEIKMIEKNALIQYDNGNISNSESGSIQPAVSIKRKRDDKNMNKLNATGLNNLSSIEPRKSKAKPTIIKRYQNSCEDLDEANTSLSFIKWLASITERINQTMHFQFDGKPDPLVFHVPQIFFDCLRERISCGGKKKRLPNSTTAFVRKDGVPLGTFTKYTWQITNILHVKSIFETPLIPLEITRSFIQNADGTYELYKRKETDIDRYKKTNNNALIKPLELKTYLKVVFQIIFLGNTSPNQVEPTPFLIEWIPDILPISKIGELRIRFEFGHVKNEASQRWRKIALSKNY
ncbi:uncharacterized protein C2orf42 homolog isoform X4 [Vespa velutina]|uniref:uncharacterized protein C2orf42 homolog isoform X4 n=1 Tax=Vespa crabro TaxID=7445 RepID=UPI001F029907|nr:uncharacterized protein C2orf42 homolog isoform X4 [Vespa crabro]XP_047351074.1 uncharacterized protein C2orf42 homolog isoform X4 [Vespa velutina]